MVDASWGLARRIWHQFDSIPPKCTRNRTFLNSQLPFWHHESSLSWFLLRGFGSNLIDIALFCQVTYRLTSTYTELTSFWQHMKHQSHIGTVSLYPLSLSWRYRLWLLLGVVPWLFSSISSGNHFSEPRIFHLYITIRSKESACITCV